MTFDGLQPQLRPWAVWLLTNIQAVDRMARVTSVRRTYSQQAVLWSAYKAGRSKFPAAPPGASAHELGRAFDIKASDAALAYGGRLWQSVGGEWGAKYGDPIHFEV